MNPVTRGDLRARLASPKVLWAARIYVGALGILALLSLPPEAGRLPQLQDADLVTAFLSVQVVLTIYLTSALAVGEIFLPEEKGVADLVMSTFTARLIALGKLWTAVAFAGGLVVLSLPIVILIGSLADRPLYHLGLAVLVMIPQAAAVGVVATWLAARVEGEISRTLAHWAMLLGLAFLPRWLEGAAALVFPLQAVAATYRWAQPAQWVTVMLLYAGVAVMGCVLIGRAVVVLRGETSAAAVR